MQPSQCPLTKKPFIVRDCRRYCRHYGGVHNLVEMVCYAYGGTMEITVYNCERGRNFGKDYFADSEDME